VKVSKSLVWTGKGKRRQGQMGVGRPKRAGATQRED